MEPTPANKAAAFGITRHYDLHNPTHQRNRMESMERMRGVEWKQSVCAPRSHCLHHQCWVAHWCPAYNHLLFFPPLLHISPTPTASKLRCWLFFTLGCFCFTATFTLLVIGILTNWFTLTKTRSIVQHQQRRRST